MSLPTPHPQCATHCQWVRGHTFYQSENVSLPLLGSLLSCRGHAEGFVSGIIYIFGRWLAIQVAHIITQCVKGRLVHVKTVAQICKLSQIFFKQQKMFFFCPCHERHWCSQTLVPRAVDTFATSMILVLLPTPVKKYNLHCKSLCRLTAITATSVSGLLMTTVWCSCAACCACKNTLVSLSSWSQAISGKRESHLKASSRSVLHYTVSLWAL